jgi:hypothetical protein
MYDASINKMVEYYVLHFYQMKPTINYYLVKTIYIICIHNFTWYVFYILYTCDVLYTIYYKFYVKYWFLIFFGYKYLLAFYWIKEKTRIWHIFSQWK